MANTKHLEILKRGVKAWNEWRSEHPAIIPNLEDAPLIKIDLSRVNLHASNLKNAKLYKVRLREAIISEANFEGATLAEVDLSRANITRANFTDAGLIQVNLREANLTEVRFPIASCAWTDFRLADLRSAVLVGADLSQADLRKADLRHADLSEASLIRSRLSGADLSGADLTGANLTGANFDNAILTGCRVYGVSAWDVSLEGADQKGLIITPSTEANIIEVDNLEVAQFLYLLLKNDKIRNVIDTITSKLVLILGRFTPKRKKILEAIRNELRNRNYIPVLFDFMKPTSRDLTETIRTLAHLARFVIADISSPRSIPHELQAIVPGLSVPIQPLIHVSQREYSMFNDLLKYDWVLEPYRYANENALLAELDAKVISPPEKRAAR